MNIVQSGNTFTFANDCTIIKNLEPATYLYECGKFGPYLTKIEEIKLPKTIYSNDKNFINHVLYTWSNTEDSLGISLTGKKGLGKSFTANVICNALKIPIIKITKSISKQEGFFEFLNGIKQEHIIFIDEFEKIFSDKNDTELSNVSQKDFLSFLDGANSSNVKKMFIITTNETICPYFVNRPSRLKYIKDYSELHIETLKEIIEDKLNNKEFLEDLINNIDTSTANIDIVLKIIEEINLHNKSYSSFKDFFNYKLDNINYILSVQKETAEIFDKKFFVNFSTYLLIKNKTLTYTHQFGDIIIDGKEYEIHFDINKINLVDIKDSETIIPLSLQYYNREKDEYELNYETKGILKKNMLAYVL